LSKKANYTGNLDTRKFFRTHFGDNRFVGSIPISSTDQGENEICQRCTFYLFQDNTSYLHGKN